MSVDSFRPVPLQKITSLVTHPFAAEKASVMPCCADAADVIATKHTTE